MKVNYKLTVIIFLCFIITSCKKVIDLQLANTAPQLVIEGNLTDQQGVQTITISQSVPLGNTNTFPTVTGATVKISDSNGTNSNLTERTPGTYTINNFFGKADHVYTLHVSLNGQNYTATSTMPEKVNLDSLSISLQSFGNSTTKTVAVYYQDTPGVPNQYRMVLYINNVEVKDVFVRNDQFSDGRQVQALLYQNDITIKTGDKIDVDLQCIDPPIYTYWYTFSQEGGNGFDNSATPSNPPNNFTPSVLGYFSAHTIQRKTIIAN